MSWFRKTFFPTTDDKFAKFKAEVIRKWLPKLGWDGDTWNFDCTSLEEEDDTVDRSADRNVVIPFVFSYQKQAIFPRYLFMAQSSDNMRFICRPMAQISGSLEALPVEIAVVFDKPIRQAGVVVHTHWHLSTESLRPLLCDPEDKTLTAARGIADRKIHLVSGKIDHGAKLAVAPLPGGRAVLTHRSSTADWSGDQYEFAMLESNMHAVLATFVTCNDEAPAADAAPLPGFDFYLQLCPAFIRACGDHYPLSELKD